MRRMPSATICTTLPSSSAVGFRAIARTRPYFPFPIRFVRSSIRFWISQDFSTSFVAILPHHVHADLAGFPGLARPKDLLALHAREDDHAPHLMLQGGVDRRAPDDPRVRGDLRLHELRRLLRLAHGHVGAARHVDQRARRLRDVDVDERGVDRLCDGVLRARILLALPEPDHRDAAAAHDRLDVVEVEVHEAGLRDDLRDALDPPHEDVVRDLERLVQREARDELDELVVRDPDARVREVPQPFEAKLRVLPADDAFRAEGPRAYCDGERAEFLRNLGDDGRAAGAGSPAKTARDEHEVRAAEDLAQLLFRLPRALLSDLWKRTGAEAARAPPPEENLVRGADHEQVLRVRVRGVRLR